MIVAFIALKRKRTWLLVGVLFGFSCGLAGIVSDSLTFLYWVAAFLYEDLLLG